MDRVPISTLFFALTLSACVWPKSAIPHMLRMDPLKAQTDLFSAGKYDPVIAELTPSTIHKLRRSDRARAYTLLGLSHAQLGNIDQALSTYQLAEGLFPKDINILSGLANLLHQIGLNEQAIPYYERILKIHPHNTEAHRGLAEITRAQGLLPESCDHYEKALKEESKDPVAWRDYAEVLAERQDFTKATEAIRHSLELARDVDSVLDLALFERRQGLRDRAYQRIEEASLMAPTRTDLRNREALWRLEDGQINEAFRISAKTLEKDSEDPLARWVQASVELRRGSLEAAESDLIALAAQRKQPFIAQTALAMLKELRSTRSRRYP